MYPCRKKVANSITGRSLEKKTSNTERKNLQKRTKEGGGDKTGLLGGPRETMTQFVTPCSGKLLNYSTPPNKMLEGQEIESTTT